MKCAICNSPEHRVVDTVERGDVIRRRRECGRCKHRWNTFELAQPTMTLARDHIDALRAIFDQRG